MGWEPWSSGYGIHSRSVDRGFTDDGCPDVMLVWKDENKRKRGLGWPIQQRYPNKMQK